MNKESPLVSIVIPTKNRKLLLKDAVQSVLNQTYKNIEIIIHDNNSMDGTEYLIKQIFQDSRIKFFRTEKDLSMLENWSLALSYVTGDFLIRLDDDNVFFNNIIEQAVLEIEKNELQVIIYSAITSTPDGRIIKIFEEKKCPLKILTPYEFLTLEFYCYTDTNYILYNKEFLIGIFGKLEDIYLTTQPDRYLNYVISAKMIENSGIKVAFSSKILGFSRYDYRPAVRNSYKLIFNTYKGFPNEPSSNVPLDCHYNFQMHRILNLIIFMRESNCVEINSFIEAKFISSPMYSVYALLGHITESPIETNIIDLLKLNLMYGIVILRMIFNPFLIIDGKYTCRYTLSVVRLCIMKNFRSIFAIFTPKEIIKKNDCNYLSYLIINGENISHYIDSAYMPRLISKIKIL